VIVVKTPKQINGIRESCKLARKTLLHTGKYVKPGISTEKLNNIAHQFIIKNNAIPAPLNYKDFPKSISVAVNNVVCHGIPSDKDILKNGNIINIDITTILNGFYGDTSITFPVGKISPQAQKLIDVAKKAMQLAIATLKPNKLLNDCIGKTIENYVSKFGYSPVRELGGHGVGLEFHEEPFVFHHHLHQERKNGETSNPTLKPGMIFTIEPMINASSNWQIEIDKNDGWTVRTIDNALSAQFEHTVLITDTGHEILTKL